MKKILASLIFALVVTATPVFAVTTVPWVTYNNATTSPARVGGVDQEIKASNFIGTSTSLFSTFASRVGIATTEPAYTLDVLGSAQFVFPGGYVPTILDQNGIFGSGFSLNDGSGTVFPGDYTIGAAGPLTTYGLQVFSNNASGNAFSIESQNGWAAILNTVNLTNDQTFSFPNNSGTIALTSDIIPSQWTTNGSKIYYNTGNVGIGTTSPYAKLSINALNGETNNTLFQISSSTAAATTSLFSVFNNGKVGIGSSSPTQLLGVAGNIDLSAGYGYYSNGQFIGSATGTPANHNFLLAGNNTRPFGTPFPTTGSTFGNILIGYLAGSRMIDGSNNTIFGETAAEDALSPIDNVIVGVGAGAFGNVETENVLIGKGSGTSGDNNQNVALGKNTINGINHSQGNVAIGYSAMSAAGPTSATSTNNIAIGFQAGLGNGFNTNLNKNILIGAQAGYRLQASSRNIIIGNYDSTSIGPTAASGNIIIGDSLDTLALNAQNALDIGNLIFGTNLSSTSVMSTGKVGIATSSPAKLLDIFSTATSTVRIDSNSTTKGSCLVLKDSDGVGYTYVSASNGVLTASTVSCE